MSSKKANEKHFGGLKEYRASEGREIIIEYRGSVKNTVNEILGGLRSACTYVGASKLKDLSKCATFIRTNNQYNKIFEK
jgi:GMP reductase